MEKICLVLAMFLIVLGLSSCKSKIKIEDVLPFFYEHVIKSSEQYSVTINSLNAYSEDEWEFFDVEIEKNYKGEIEKYELIYVYQYSSLDCYFNINDGESFEFQFNKFLNAQKAGRHLVINEADYTAQIKIAYDKKAEEQ